jgi:hypothetical protein
MRTLDKCDRNVSMSSGQPGQPLSRLRNSISKCCPPGSTTQTASRSALAHREKNSTGTVNKPNKENRTEESGGAGAGGRSRMRADGRAGVGVSLSGAAAQ